MLSIAKKQKLKNTVQMVLHVPGNYTGGILEMAIVADHAAEQRYIKELAADVATALKQTDETFRNVRLNYIDWYSDDNINCMNSSLPMLQMGRPFEEWKQIEEHKRIEVLCEYLKKFQARSKLIIVFVENICIEDREQLDNSLKPFLGKKLILVHGEEIIYRSLGK